MLEQQIDYPTRLKTSAMIMKLFQIILVVLVLLINLAIAFPSWAERAVSLTSNPNYFEVGQKVIWLYKPRTDSSDVQRIPAEVIKLSSKQVQIKVYKHNKEFVNRWVNSNKLENSQKIKE
ncbi:MULTISPECIES: hypothetical protein [unclassified Nostoc]|uniref:hypothetical protein n=1 Tax=unclassified Nostoc TaxID=2593658 RepID=UPI00263799F3|nr:hypothetical protein [Nostoc sp. S13]MDF5735684.1 hypothetical protein [Nostoc sp. S13]